MRFKIVSKLLIVLGLGSTLLVANNYNVDASHSKVSFKIKHMMISNVTGNFKKFKGSFSLEDKKITAVKGEIDANSVDTDSAKRDEHLRSADFFDTKNHPKITFVMTGSKGDKIIGDLTIRGITKSVAFEAEYGGEVDDPWGNHRAGIALSAKIDRNDFKVSYKSNNMLIANDVKLIIELEGIQAE